MLAILESKAQGVLTIEATNFKNENGVAIVHLFREMDDVPKKPFRQATGKIFAGKATVAFADLPYGDYAAILFHDENANGMLDHRFGIPNEPMGFSNGWHLSLFSGMPTFKKLRFEFRENKLRYEVVIR